MGTRFSMLRISTTLLFAFTFIPTHYTQTGSFYNRLRRLLQGTPKRSTPLRKKTAYQDSNFKQLEEKEVHKETLNHLSKKYKKDPSLGKTNRIQPKNKDDLKIATKKAIVHFAKKKRRAKGKDTLSPQTQTETESNAPIISETTEIDNKPFPPEEAATPNSLATQRATNIEPVKDEERPQFKAESAYPIDSFTKLANQLVWTNSNNKQNKIIGKIEKDSKIVEKVDKDNNTILHLSILNDTFYITQFLLEKYPELKDKKNKFGETPYDLANKIGNKSMLELFKESKYKNADSVFFTLTDMLTRESENLNERVSQDVEFLNTLAEALKFNPKIIQHADNNKNNLLHLAVINNRVWAVKELRKKYHILEAQVNKDKKTPFDLAAEKLEKNEPGAPFLMQMFQDSLPEDPIGYEPKLPFLRKNSAKPTTSQSLLEIDGLDEPVVLINTDTKRK